MWIRLLIFVSFAADRRCFVCFPPLYCIANAFFQAFPIISATWGGTFFGTINAGCYHCVVPLFVIFFFRWFFFFLHWINICLQRNTLKLLHKNRIWLENYQLDCGFAFQMTKYYINMKKVHNIRTHKLKRWHKLFRQLKCRARIKDANKNKMRRMSKMNTQKTERKLLIFFRVVHFALE